MNDHLTQLVTCITPKQPQVGTTAVSDAAGLLSTWIVLYAAVGTAKSAKTMMETTREIAKGNLQAQLFKNILTLA